MENHPIPQDVTGFQFKLIGNMTVKQFAYLVTGVVFGWIFLQLPITILIKFPLAAFCAILGLGLAYFPISGRPMDAMISNYIKALFRPTEFVYEKVGGQIYFPNRAPIAIAKSVRQYKNDFSPFPKDKLKTYLESLDNKPKNKVDEKEASFLSSVYSLTKTNINVPNQPAASSPMSAQAFPQPNLITYESFRQLPKKETSNAQQLVPTSYPPVASPIPQETTDPITKPIPQPSISKKSMLQTTPARQTPPPQSVLQGTAPTTTSPLKRLGKPIALPSAPDFPNLITGVAKDPRGNALSNILIEIKDKDGNPIRAFKTNELGRFASATPLSNGTYTIDFEDTRGQNKFEKIIINATGQVIMPIEAISVDAREELRRALFASSNKSIN